MNLGKKISNLRKKHNLTQEALAEKMNISRQTLLNWETDTTSPNILQASNLAKLFSVSLDDLLDVKTEVECQKDKLLNKLIGKTCLLDLGDIEDYRMMDYKKKFKIVGITDDFIKIEFTYKKDTIIKLLDISLVAGIELVGED
ncbi:MAG TPA: hypothetical protein DCY94_02560 [Firmicutes bacterium]|nr:hypothetical protein [Bacillota bacterium]